MPCYVVLNVTVENEEAAREAMKEHGINESALQKVGKSWRVTLPSGLTEGRFKATYAEKFTIREAKKKFYRMAERTTDKDGNIRIRLKR